ncbi:MAG: ROK family protein [Acidobacteria bacterium]|nr:ROK family protein [Acidobacteriota bacterium]
MSAAGSASVLAFDVGGTDIKVGLVTGRSAPGQPDGVVVTDLQRLATPRDAQRPGDAVVDEVVRLTQQYVQSHPGAEIAAVGVTVPGLVDEIAGAGIYSANLGWRDFPFVERLSRQLGLPVAFGHDVATAGEAEFRIGAARSCKNALVMVVGTGIAAAVFADGQRIRGDGYAGEIGHAMVPTTDGSLAILESLGSAGAVARRYAELRRMESSAESADSSDVEAHNNDGARGVLAAARNGDTLAQRVWQDATDAIAFGIAQCVSILGTDTVVLGGGLAEAGEELLAPVASRVDALLTFHRRPRILRAALGHDAGLIGSALRAHELLDGLDSQLSGAAS